MLRTAARITDDRFTTLRIVGFALASSALVALATACGGDVEMKEVGDVSTPSTTPVAEASTVRTAFTEAWVMAS